MAERDFNDDEKDAGELGSGHTVTALHEVIPKGGAVPAQDALAHQTPAASGGPVASGAPAGCPPGVPLCVE